jgi:hypothetical protein
MRAPAQPAPRYTWSDHQTWPEDERREIIDGVAYNLSPAPATRHQTVAGNFFAKLAALCPASAAALPSPPPT